MRLVGHQFDRFRMTRQEAAAKKPFNLHGYFILCICVCGSVKERRERMMINEERSFDEVLACLRGRAEKNTKVYSFLAMVKR
jgi:hypothetical protein